MADFVDIRLAVASQPTVEQSLIAAIRAIISQIEDASVSEDPEAMGRVLTYLKMNPKALSDAIMANTPQALETASLTTPVPVLAEGAGDEEKIAAQSSIGQSIVALVRAIAGHIEGSIGSLEGMRNTVEYLRSNTAAFTDAVMANTPLAAPDSKMDVAPPAHVAGAFAGAPEDMGAEPEAADEPVPEIPPVPHVDPVPENAQHVMDKHITDTGETGTNPPPSQNPAFGASPEPNIHPGDRAAAAAAMEHGTVAEPAPEHAPEHAPEPAPVDHSQVMPPSAPPHGE